MFNAAEISARVRSLTDAERRLVTAIQLMEGGEPTGFYTFEVSGADEARQAIIEKLNADLAPDNLLPPARFLSRRAFKEAALGLGLFDALKAAAAKAKAKDKIYWEDEDTFVENNPKLGRIETAAKVDVTAVYDAGLA